jgi:hypothetical protein
VFYEIHEDSGVCNLRHQSDPHPTRVNLRADHLSRPLLAWTRDGSTELGITATCLSEKAALGTSFDGRSFTPPDIQLIRMGPVTLASIAEVRMP